MNFFDFVDISERYMELVNPSSPDKLVKLGKFLRLGPGKRVVDFAFCGWFDVIGDDRDAGLGNVA